MSSPSTLSGFQRCVGRMLLRYVCVGIFKTILCIFYWHFKTNIAVWEGGGRRDGDGWTGIWRYAADGNSVSFPINIVFVWESIGIFFAWALMQMIEPLCTRVGFCVSFVCFDELWTITYTVSNDRLDYIYLKQRFNEKQKRPICCRIATIEKKHVRHFIRLIYIV